jgi:hypothetical protein
MNRSNVLEKFTPYDLSEVDELLAKLDRVCMALSSLEKNYKVKSYEDRKTFECLDNKIKAEFTRNWSELNKISDSLDFIFFED